LSTDWLVFRQLRNKRSSLIKKAKSKFYLSGTTDSLNDPRRFWKVIKSLSVSNVSHTLSTCIMKDSVAVHDQTDMLNCFNEHFISSVFLSDQFCTVPMKPCSDVTVNGTH